MSCRLLTVPLVTALAVVLAASVFVSSAAAEDAKCPAPCTTVQTSKSNTDRMGGGGGGKGAAGVTKDRMGGGGGGKGAVQLNPQPEPPGRR